VTRIEHGDTAGEIDEAPTLDVPNFGIFRPIGKNACCAC